MEKLLAFLAEVSADYLVAQIDAGADAVQIFDSWAGVLAKRNLRTTREAGCPDLSRPCVPAGPMRGSSLSAKGAVTS